MFIVVTMTSIGEGDATPHPAASGVPDGGLTRLGTEPTTGRNHPTTVALSTGR
jgi:hypothetical protein